MTGRPLAEVIAAEIGRRGPLPFSRYMDLALYHPVRGFYASRGAGRRGDFITSPEVGPLFGAVVARALDRWWDELDRPDPFVFVDAGAGTGALARAVLRAEPRCLVSLEYVAVETSEIQRERHPSGIASVAAMPDDVDVGVVFANELLDNLPFDVFDHDPTRGWCEVRVDVAGDAFTEVLVATDLADLPAPERELGAVRVPRQHAAADWLGAAVGALQRGRVVVVDYAVPSYPVEAGHQWLRTYAEHDRGRDPLSAPGMQDVTADVDIARLSSVRRPTLAQSQADWLRSHGIDELVGEGREYWAAHAAAPDLVALAMQSRVPEAAALLDPGGLGGFTVLEWEIPTGGETQVTR